MWLTWLCLAVIGICLVALGGLWLLLDANRRMFRSIPVVPPSDTLGHDVNDECQLFKYLPALKGKVAWTSLGSYPTPVDAAIVNVASRSPLTVYYKREDCSSERYGGNKVRTMEFQLACCAVAAEKDQKKRREEARPLGRSSRVYATGGPGSNQVIACAVHSAAFEGVIEPRALWMMPEAATYENGLNMASTYSMGLACLPFFGGVGFLKTAMTLKELLYSEDSPDFIMVSGGANPTGCLGHVAAAFEFAAQVRAGEAEAPTRIFLPLGSGCTTSGLIIGICLARRMGVEGFHKLKKLHSVGIHQMMRFFDGYIPRFLVANLVRKTCRVIRRLGGPDVEEDAVRFMAEEWQLEVRYTGNYGEPTDESLAARDFYESEVTMVGGEEAKERPWLCHTFGSKLMACLLQYLGDGAFGDDESVCVWATKSLVQPVGDVRPVARVQELARHHRKHERSNTYLKNSKILEDDDLYLSQYVRQVSRLPS